MGTALDQTAAAGGKNTGSAFPNRAALLAAFVWAVFVVYGSLLPFDYTPQPFDLALDQFRHIALLNIGPGDRADWMANLLLYVPLAFLCMAGLDRPVAGIRRVLETLLVVLGLCALATAIEFAQIFFPPRTVSLNDLIAEWLGILAGTATWLCFGSRARALYRDFAPGGGAAARALGIAYVIAYFGLALFPFDFLLTTTEWTAKDPAQIGWWLAPRACVRSLQCGAQLATEILFAMALGLAFVLSRRGSRPSTSVLVWVGLLIGAGIELAQLLLGSGVSQGISVVAKTVGFVMGGLLAPHVGHMLSKLRAWRYLNVLIVLLVFAYGTALALVLDVAHGETIPWRQAIDRLADMRLMPFYYYYYTSETRAFASLLVQAALYLPPGIFIGLVLRSRGGMKGAILAGAASGMVALAAQVARLLHPPQRADPTDVLIAFAAGWGGYHVTRLLVRLASGNERPPEHPRSAPTHLPKMPELGRRWIVVTLLAVAQGLFIARFPVAQWELALGLIACFWIVYRSPGSWLVILLMLLPTLDLAPWSGRYYLDEFDAFALALFVGAAMRLPGAGSIRWPGWLALSFGLFVLSGLIAIGRGMVPWPNQSFLELAGYQSPLNALRVGRGLLWACVLLWLIGRVEPDPMRERSRFALGMTAGLCCVGLIVLWERIVFTGPFNFDHEYRVAGTFSAISTAGAQIESYLAAATPFAMLIALRGHGALKRLFGLFALALMVYTVASTASRSAYAGVALAAGIMTLAWIWSAQDTRRKLFAAVLVPAFGVLAWMLVGGTYVTHRMADSGRDLAQREAHWAMVLDLMGSEWTTRLFGMGTGQYPPTFLWKAPIERRPGTFAFIRAGNESFLRLGAGHAVYVEQFVPVENGQPYTVRGRLRAQSGAPGTLNLALCDKWILYGLDCVGADVSAQGSGGWELFARPLVASTLARGPPFFRRPVKLALYNVGSNVIDVTDVRLEDAQGRNILQNGDFAHAGDRWYFSADDHFPWNIFNLFLEIYFEQGWLGLIAFAASLAGVLLCLFARAARGDLLAAAFFSAVLGFLVPGLFDSVIDDPRMRLLLMLLLCASVLLTSRDQTMPKPAYAA